MGPIITIFTIRNHRNSIGNYWGPYVTRWYGVSTRWLYLCLLAFLRQRLCRASDERLPLLAFGRRRETLLQFMQPFQASVDSELLLREVAGDECHLSCSQEGKPESWSPCCCHDHDVIAWVCDYARRASEEAPSQMQFSLRIQTEVAVDAQQPGRGDEHGSNAHHSWRCTCIHLRYKNNNLKII